MNDMSRWIAVVLTAAGLVGGGVFGYGELNAQTKTNTEDIIDLKQLVREQLRTQQETRESLVRIDERLGGIEEDVNDIQDEQRRIRGSGGGSGGTFDSYSKPDIRRGN